VDDLAILIPVLGRPHTIADVVASIRGSGTAPQIVFIATVGDFGVLAAVRDIAAGSSDIDLLTMRRTRLGDYAKKINYGFDNTSTSWVFTAASDLRFHAGWVDAAKKAMDRPEIGVVGTNDLGNSRVMKGEHSTHSLVRRTYVNEYGLIDRTPGKVLYEGYVHEYVDDELVGTAMHRNAWAMSPRSIVEHLHPQWGKAENDDMYALSNRRMRASRRTFQERKRLWTCK